MRFYKDGGQIVDGSSNAIELTTTYTTAQVPDVKFAQTADVMYLVHPAHPPRKLTRSSHTSWSITDVDLKRGAMLDPDITTTPNTCLLYTSPSPRDGLLSRMPSSA